MAEAFNGILTRHGDFLAGFRVAQRLLRSQTVQDRHTNGYKSRVE